MKIKKYKFYIVLVSVLVIIASIFIGGYFAIDKLLIPKYFGSYDIKNLNELVELMETIYAVPSENEFITNPYVKADSTSITTKLTNAGLPTLSNGDIDFDQVKKGYTRTVTPEYASLTHLKLTDKEVAALTNQILDSGILITYLPELEYLDTLKMEVKQIIIAPKLLSDNVSYSTTNANLIATIKIDTTSAKKQIAKNLDTPEFLIDWIIPPVIYLTANFETDIIDSTRQIIAGSLAVNGKTAKQSEVLLKLLISFIYPTENNITISSLTNQLGSLVLDGLNVVGNFEFALIEQTDKTQIFGIIVELSSNYEIKENLFVA